MTSLPSTRRITPDSLPRVQQNVVIVVMCLTMNTIVACGEIAFLTSTWWLACKFSLPVSSGDHAVSSFVLLYQYYCERHLRALYSARRIVLREGPQDLVLSVVTKSSAATSPPDPPRAAPPAVPAAPRPARAQDDDGACFRCCWRRSGRRNGRRARSVGFRRC